jgi:predicted enzyme related to lactoylglutathione lyase
MTDDMPGTDAGASGSSLLVNIDVDDLAVAERFYGMAFGLTVGRRFGSFGVEMLGHGMPPLYLLVKPAGTAPAPTVTQSRRYERHWTPVHLDFVVDDIDAAVARAVHAGAVVEQPAATHRWGRLALLADPFGHGFCFVQFVGRGYDEVADVDPA